MSGAVRPSRVVGRRVQWSSAAWVRSPLPISDLRAPMTVPKKRDISSKGPARGGDS